MEKLACLLLDDNRPDAAGDVAFQIIDLLPEKGQEIQLCRSHQILGRMYSSKGAKETAIHHFQTALTIASVSNWPHELFCIHFLMARLFRDEDKFNNANTHIRQAKLHAADNPYDLGHGMRMQARIWYRQRRLEDVRSEAFHALKTFQRLGAANDAGGCKRLLWRIEEAMRSRISGTLHPGCETSVHDATSYHR